MEFFSVIGKIVQGSGFEEVVYQAGLCTSGGIKGVLSGKHYNRSWRIHECLAEAIERLFCEALVESCPDELETAIKAILTDMDCKDVISQRPFRAYEEKDGMSSGSPWENCAILDELLESYRKTTRTALFSKHE